MIPDAERPQIVIRPATGADAAAIAHVHVTAWQETYTGLIPKAILASQSVAQRTVRWQNMLERPGDSAVFVAHASEMLVGFGACGTQRDAALRDQGFTGEITAIYLLRSAQRSGVGTALMAAMAGELSKRGHVAASAWVLRENIAAQQFYEQLGGELVGKKEDQRPGATLVEVAYGWRDIGRLLNAAATKKL